MTIYTVKTPEGVYTIDLSAVASAPAFVAGQGVQVTAQVKLTLEPASAALSGRRIGLVQLISPMSKNAPGYAQRAYDDGWAVDTEVPNPVLSKAAANAVPTNSNPVRAAAEQRAADAERLGIKSALIYGCDRLGQPKPRTGKGLPFPEVEYSMTFAEEGKSKVTILTDRPIENVVPKNPPSSQATSFADYPFDLVRNEFIGFGVRWGYQIDGAGRLSIVAPTAGVDVPWLHLQAINQYIKLATADSLIVVYPKKKAA